MTKLALLAAPLLVVTFATVATEAPKAGQEVKKLEVFAGTWRTVGETPARPDGSPASKDAGTATGRMILNGFALELRGSLETAGTAGAFEFVELYTYDVASKTYRYFGAGSEGTTWSGSAVNSGNTWETKGTWTIANGTSVLDRGEMVFSADNKSYRYESETSADGGKTWTPSYRYTATKTN